MVINPIISAVLLIGSYFLAVAARLHIRNFYKIPFLLLMFLFLVAEVFILISVALLPKGTL